MNTDIRKINAALLVVETAWTGWLGYAHAAFTGVEGLASLQSAAGLAMAGGVASLVTGGPSPRPLRATLGVTCVALLARFVAPASSPVLSWPAVAWVTAVVACTGLLLRQRFCLLSARVGNVPLAEAGRWLAVLFTATLLANPFCTHRPIGSGDAHWYTLMLSDFVLQVRAGVFPVWAGQTEYAFNGAVNPLRLAPWLQHFGALLDLVTLRQLEPIALKNALITVNFLLLGGTAYASLRWLLPARPTAAAWLSMLLLASPAVLAPLYTGDQYMTFFALPFACLAVTGFAAVMERDRLLRYLPLCAGLAGLWLTHTPIALWLSMLFGVAYSIRTIFARSPGWLNRLGVALLGFLLLGTYPIVSVVHLENTTPLATDAIGAAAAQQVIDLFPGSLLPLSKKLSEQTDYQPGYALVALAALAGLALVRRRNGSTLVLAGMLGLVLLLLLPVPVWAKAVWRHLPLWLMQVNGSWPHQRLIPIAAILTVYLGALMLRDQALVVSRRVGAALAALALLAIGWSGAQAAGFVRNGWKNTGRGPNPALGFQTNNLTLTRYAFSSFATVPGYYTHGYINPLLEHRLLRADGTVLSDNAAAAASEPIGTEVAQGTFTAVNDNGTAHYNLFPRVWLPGMQQLLLKVEPLEKIERGWFQVAGQDVFREYMLPDSGTGVVRSTPLRAFGTLPESSSYLPLRTRLPHGEAPRLTVILPDLPLRTEFPFARFELWQFDPARLPVAVRSWAPYRLHVTSPASALLETPRVWLAGYYATVNGRRLPVERSADGLAMFPVPAGETDVTVRYAPPWPVQVSYWLTVASWSLGILWLATTGWRAARPTAQRTSTG